MKVHYLLIILFLIGILTLSGCAEKQPAQPSEGEEIEPSEGEEIEERAEQTSESEGIGEIAVSGKCDCDAYYDFYQKYMTTPEEQEGLQKWLQLCKNPSTQIEKACQDSDDKDCVAKQRAEFYGAVSISMYMNDIWTDGCMCRDMLTGKARDGCYAILAGTISQVGASKQDIKTMCNRIQDSEIKTQCMSANRISQ